MCLVRSTVASSTPPSDRDGQPDASDCDPAILMARLTNGDVAALEALMNLYWQPLAAYASRLLDDLDTAEDVVQGVFVRVWVGRASWTPLSVRGFLFTLTRNSALDELRRRRSRVRMVSLGVHHRTVGPKTPVEVLEEHALAATVDEAIRKLPPRRREIFDLVYLRGFSYQEAGDVMGISPKTVGNQMTAALRYLRSALKPLLTEERGSEPTQVCITQGDSTRSLIRSELHPSHPIGK